MKKLKIDKEGKIFYDGNEIPRKEIDNKFLDLVFQNSLKNEIDFEIDESDPVSLLFKRIKEETDPESEFYKKVTAIRKDYKENLEEKSEIENAESENDLPF